MTAYPQSWYHQPKGTSFPMLPDHVLHLKDVQLYVRLWPAKHIIASKQPSDGLLECTCYWKYPGCTASIIQATRPSDEGPMYLLNLNDKLYVLPTALQQVQLLWVQFPAMVASRENWQKHVENSDALKSLAKVEKSQLKENNHA